MISHSKIVRYISFSTDRASSLDVSGMEEFTKAVRLLGDDGIVLFDQEMHDHETVFWNLYRVSDIVEAMHVTADDKLAYILENGSSGESENAIAANIRAGGIVEINGSAWWVRGKLPYRGQYVSRKVTKDGLLGITYTSGELRYKIKGAQ